MSVAWAQFRELGLPRCKGFGPGGCERIIWPWQDWICEIEAWPGHHACHHRYLAYMKAAGIKDGWDSDDYDRCGYCQAVIAPDDSRKPTPPRLLDRTRYARPIEDAA